MSAAVGAFLVGIALSGPVAHHATELLAPLRDLFAAVFFVFFGLVHRPAGTSRRCCCRRSALAVVTMATKVLTGYLAARRVGIALPGRWRAGCALVPRGEFSIVIAGLAVGRRRRTEAGAARHRVRADHRRDRPDAGPAAGLRLVQAPASRRPERASTPAAAGRGGLDTPDPSTRRPGNDPT